MSFGSNPENFDFFPLHCDCSKKLTLASHSQPDSLRVPKLQVVCIFVFKPFKSQK